MKVRFRNAEFLEEDIADAVIVVLTYVDQAPVEHIFVRVKFADDGGDLHEVGAGAGDKCAFGAGGHGIRSVL